jgi:hypothetical protein
MTFFIMRATGDFFCHQIESKKNALYNWIIFIVLLFAFEGNAIKEKINKCVLVRRIILLIST